MVADGGGSVGWLRFHQAASVSLSLGGAHRSEDDKERVSARRVKGRPSCSATGSWLSCYNYFEVRRYYDEHDEGELVLRRQTLLSMLQ